MDKEIIANLYEFWSYIGIKTDRLTETKEYKVDSMMDSDWPNRIFSISNKPAFLTKVIAHSQQVFLPNIITISKPNNLENYPEFQFMFGQRNMALDLQKMKDSYYDCKNIYQVKSQESALKFANIASEAFGYRVDEKTAHIACQDSSKIRIFYYAMNVVSWLRNCLFRFFQ
jgi:hypothetical protein